MKLPLEHDRAFILRTVKFALFSRARTADNLDVLLNAQWCSVIPNAEKFTKELRCSVVSLRKTVDALLLGGKF